MNINLFQILFQIINFTILLFLLRKYLYKPVLKILEQRSKKIHDGLEAAEKSIEEREKLDKLKKKMSVEAEKTASEIVDSARKRAKKAEADLTQKAEEALQKRIKRAEAHAKAQGKQLERELQKKFSKSVISTTQTLLQDSLSRKEQREIIDRHLEKIKNVRFSAN